MKHILFFVFCSLSVLLILPCVVPCLIQLIQPVVGKMGAVVVTSADDVKYVRIVSLSANQPTEMPIV